jgi:MFS transporter, ACS family, tartrate transporter
MKSWCISCVRKSQKRLQGVHSSNGQSSQSLCCWMSPGCPRLPMYATQGIIYTIPASFLQGKSAAMGIAAVTTMGILGGFAGPAWMGWMKDFTGSYQLGLMTLVFPCLVAAATVLGLRHTTLTGRKELDIKERFHA